jgi:hypothetical protein
MLNAASSRLVVSGAVVAEVVVDLVVVTSVRTSG